jgi:hypothetical protein
MKTMVISTHRVPVLLPRLHCPPDASCGFPVTFFHPTRQRFSKGAILFLIVQPTFLFYSIHSMKGRPS